MLYEVITLFRFQTYDLFFISISNRVCIVVAYSMPGFNTYKRCIFGLPDTQIRKIIPRNTHKPTVSITLQCHRSGFDSSENKRSSYNFV